MERMRSLAEILPGLIGQLPLRPETVLRSLWPSLVGNQLAAHTEPRALGDGVLRVAVSDPAWKTELRALETVIIAKINGLAGKPLVRELRLELRREGAGEEAIG